MNRPTAARHPAGDFGSLRVMHVVSSTDRRGAQLFASDLVAALRGSDVAQRVVALRGTDGPATLFEAPTRILVRDAVRSRFDLRVARGLRAEMAAFQPDVIQAHGGETLKYTVPLTVGHPRSVVYRRIGSTPVWASTKAQRKMYGALMRRSASVVAVSEATRSETIEMFHVDPERIVTIPNAVAAGRMRPGRPREEVRTEIGVSADAHMVLSVGALTWEKDPLGQLAIAEAAMRRAPGVVLVLAGDGPLRRDLESEIEERGLAGVVRLLGVRQDVPDLLAASDVLLLASSTEGMPAVVIEAGLLGLPVAAHALGGVPDVVESGRTGVLAAPGDRDGLAASLADLLRDGNRRAAMGRAAAERCRGAFEISAVALRYLEVYERVASAPSRRTADRVT